MTQETQRNQWIGSVKGGVAAVLIMAIGGFIWDYFTTDPEHALTKTLVSSNTQVIQALTKNFAAQQVAVNKLTNSITDLSIDRALPALESALKTIDRLEGKDRVQWTEEERELYQANVAQRDSARARLRDPGP